MPWCGAARGLGPVGYRGDCSWLLISTKVLGVHQRGGKSDSRGRAALVGTARTQQSEHPSAAGPELCAGLLEVACSPGSRHPSELWSRAGAGGPSPQVLAGCWQGAVPPVLAWRWAQHPSLFARVLPNCPLGLHVPERSDVLVGGHLLHLQALIGVVLLQAFLAFTFI